jgi:hypothetical protein
VIIYFVVTGGDDGGTTETDPTPSAIGIGHMLQSLVS